MTHSGINYFLYTNIALESLIGMSTLMIAILIPLSIFIIGSNPDHMYTWDKAVIMSKVLNAPRLFLAVFLLSMPLLFWKSSLEVKPEIVGLYIIGLIVLTTSIVKAYRWLRILEKGLGQTYRTKIRIKYLKKLKINDMCVIWPLVWSDIREHGLIDERELLDEFMKQIDALNDRNKSKIGTPILQEFILSLDKIDISDPVLYDKISEIGLKWSGNLINDNLCKFNLLGKKLFFDLMEKSLNDRVLSVLFYSSLKKYFMKKDNDFIKAGETITNKFFSIIEQSDAVNFVLEDFPEEWKVSLSNLTEKNHFMSEIWLNSYMKWVTSRKLLINPKTFKYDEFASRVTKTLFPFVDIVMWSDLLILHWAPFELRADEDPISTQVRNFVELDKSFGYIGRAIEFSPIEIANKLFIDKYYQEQDEVLGLIKDTNIFPNFKDISILDKLINAFSLLKFEKGTVLERKSIRVKNSLINIKESLSKK